MKKKAIILDLDNTIYSAPSISDKLFASIYQLIAESSEHSGNIDAIKKDMKRKPFRVVAAKHNFSQQLTQHSINILQDMAYEDAIEPFSDYKEARLLSLEKYLVTTGFTKLQQSKIKGLRIEGDFKEIHIIDPGTSDKTKKDVFADIIKRNGYSASEVLVVGDDPESELKAAHDLGIDAVLYDKLNMFPDTSLRKITDYRQLGAFL